METVKGWDTTGISDIGMIADGRVNLTFKGLDGQSRDILIPGASIGQAVVSLIAASAEFEARQSGKLGEAIPSTHLMGINQSQVAADALGTEFAVVLRTKDGLAMRFLFDRNTIEALATALVGTLAKHGIQVDPRRPEGSTH
jgi:hypothetical protein